MWKGIILNNTNKNDNSSMSNICLISDLQTDNSTSKTTGDSLLLYENKSYKTNILELIQKEFEQDGKKVLFMKAEDMLCKLTSYLEKNFTTEGFHKSFSQYDCLFIDQGNIFWNKSATQQEICNLIKNLMTIGVSVIIKSSKKLNTIERMVSKKYFLE